MKNEKVIEKLMSYYQCHDLLSANSEETIVKFEKDNLMKLPPELKDLYRHFDGGEIFVPGTIIYGIEESVKRKTIKEANSRLFRTGFNIPSHYLVFAKLNFGDLVCVNLNAPFDIVQWDHETNEEYCKWHSVFEWLDEAVEEYKAYKEGAK